MSTLHLQMLILHLLVNVLGLYRIINGCKRPQNQRYEIPKHFVYLNALYWDHLQGVLWELSPAWPQSCQLCIFHQWESL